MDGARKRRMPGVGSEGNSFLAPGDVVGNRYKIVRPLGSGGMASVYLAEDLVLGETQVAIKILRQSGNFKEDLVHRFLREVRLTHKINHENVVRTFDFGQDGDTLYYTMEYLAGNTLDAAMGSEVIPLESILGIAVQLMRGISAVHAVGVIHRDIKPANVMILDEGRLKITDFGISRGGVSNLTSSSGEIVGTIAYLAPETLVGEEATLAVDYYAIGAILYQLLTGHAPIDDEVPARLIMRKVEEMPADPREYRADIPEWLAHGLMGLLEIDPKLRMRSLPTFAANLDKYAPRQLDEGLVAGLINNTLSIDKLMEDTPLHTRILRRVSFGAIADRLMLGVVLSLFAIPLSSTDTFTRMELVQSDNLFWMRGTRAPAENVAVIALEEDSYGKLNASHNEAWPRKWHAKLLNRLADDKAKRVVFDIKFFDQSRDPAEDVELAEAMKRVPTVLAAALGVKTPDGSYYKEELFRPIPILDDAAEGVGLVGLPEIFRRVRHFNVEQSSLFPEVPSLAQAALMLPENTSDLPNSRSLINFYGSSQAFKPVDYWKVVSEEGGLKPGTFTDKIVFVGLGTRSQVGPAKEDTYATPYDPGLFGVFVHATAASNIEKREWIRELPPVWSTVLCAVLATVSALIILALNGARAVVTLCFWVAGVVAAQLVLFNFLTWAPVLCPLVWGSFSGLLLRLLFSQAIYTGWSRRR